MTLSQLMELQENYIVNFNVEVGYLDLGYELYERLWDECVEFNSIKLENHLLLKKRPQKFSFNGILISPDKENKFIVTIQFKNQ